MTTEPNADEGRIMVCASLCCYSACDCSHPVLLCKGSSDFLCFRRSWCCVADDTKSKGCGFTGDKKRKEHCKIGCYCCDCGLIEPTRCCAGAEQCLCCYSVNSLPWSKDFVPEPVCTCCPFNQMHPECGCCVAPPPCPLERALNGEDISLVAAQEIDRGPVPETTTTTTDKTTTQVAAPEEGVVSPALQEVEVEVEA